MKASEAPPPGWYPDPEGRSQLRWWEGTDWSDRYRARPYSLESGYPMPGAGSSGVGGSSNASNLNVPSVNVQGVNSAQLIEQMRVAARGEASHAAQLLDQRVRAAQDTWKPLVSEYTSKVTRVLKAAAWITLMLVIAYLVFQFFVQKSMFDWVGDRIDNLGTESGLLVQVSSLLVGDG